MAKRRLGPAASAALILLGACTTMPAVGDPAVSVYAVAETEPVGTANEDAADDPAIWRNAADPAASLIVATDKKGGLYVYGLDGKVRHFLARAGLNNVDLVDMGGDGIIVFASDRSELANGKIALFRLDPVAATLASVATLSAGPGEAYGICGYRKTDGQLTIFTAPKEGNIGEWAVTLGSKPSARLLRTMTVPSQPEGCAVDPRNDTLYIGEEDGGIWRFAADRTDGELVVPVDGSLLVADLEGLALVAEGATGGWLYASSQGDNAYMRFALPSLAPAGRFRIAAGDIGSTEETDGIEAMSGDFGPTFPGGLFIAQDGNNAPHAQNFKLVPLDRIDRALADMIE